MPPEPTLWPLEAHTAAKHRLLREYLKAWIPILGRYEDRVLYFDAFAGPGKYQGGEPGSPIVALETLIHHASFPALDRTDFRFVFVEQRGDRCAQLEATIAEFWGRRGGCPANVHVRIDNRSFVEVGGEILEQLGSNRHLIPTLALIDPFGFGGAPMDLIARLFGHGSRKSEVIFNYLVDSVNRWATAGNVDEHLGELFGCDEYRDAPPTGHPRRLGYLRQLYERQLRESAGFDYVRSFEMVHSKRGRTGNYVVFGTAHITGLRVAKHAMWKVDPERGTRFSSDDAEMLTLFDREPDFFPLRRAIMTKFGGRKASVEELESFVWEDTNYLADSHLKRKTLAPMEADGLIVNVEGRDRRGTFPAGCVIEFTVP
jgi:three-Cys-motif partner protein